MAITVSKQTGTLVEFSIHVVVGAIAFTVVLAAAVGLAGLIHWVESFGWAPKWLTESAKLVEIAIFCADMIAFVLFLLTEVIKSCLTFWLDFTTMFGLRKEDKVVA